MGCMVEMTVEWTDLAGKVMEKKSGKSLIEREGDLAKIHPNRKDLVHNRIRTELRLFDDWYWSSILVLCGLQLSTTDIPVSISDLSRSGLRSSGGMAADPAVGKEQSCHENLRRFFPDNINSYISPTKNLRRFLVATLVRKAWRP